MIGLVALPMLARAECGWGLVAPFPNRLDAPFAKWGHAGAFDTAAACERQRQLAIDMAMGV